MLHFAHDRDHTKRNFQKLAIRAKRPAGNGANPNADRPLALGNPGDVKPVREGLSEMRIDYGPGYRVYFLQRWPMVVILLAGGDKRTQDADIERAFAIAKEWSDK